MRSNRGVTVGQQVRDLEGNDLGRVRSLYATGFASARGLPWLFRQEFVLRYEDVHGVSDGVLVVARAPGDVYALAAGELPASWKVEAAPGMPEAATPSEGAQVNGKA